MDKREINSIAILLIIIAGLGIYCNTLQNEFVWDDFVLIGNNDYVKDWGYLPQILRSSLYCNKNPNLVKLDKESSDFYRPLQTISYLVDHTVWKLNHGGYHLTNMLLHILTALLLYGFVGLISNNQKMSFAAALLFVCHPIHTQAVTYIAGRADVLSGLFLLLMLILYIKELYVAALASLALALLSKEISLIFPLILVAYEISFGGEKRTIKQNLIRRLGPFFALSFVYVLMRLTVLNFATESVFRAKMDFYIRLVTAPRIAIEYIRLLFFPLKLHMYRYITVSRSILDIRVIIAVIVLACLFAAMCMSRRRSRVIFFGMLWFFILLFPVLGVFAALNAQMAEHWLYLPSMGFFVVLSSIISRIYDMRSAKVLIVAIFIAVVAASSFLTFERNKDWKDDFTIYANTLKYSPYAADVHYNMGNAYLRKEMHDEALAAYQESIRLKTNIMGSYINIGGIYNSRGEHEKALAVLHKAARIDPEYALIYQAMGVVNITTERYKDAIKAYEKAIELDPELVGGYGGLGVAHLKTGSYRKSEHYLQKALKLMPYHADLHYQLGTVYFYKGNLKKAEIEWKRALDLNPNHRLARDSIEKLTP